MADSANVRTGLKTLMQDHLSSQVVSSLFNRMPLVYFLLNKDGDKKGIAGLGRPKVNGEGGLLLTGVSAAKARREQIFGSLTYLPLIQTKLPAASDGKAITSMQDNDPVRTAWENNPTSGYFKRPVFRWFIKSDPYKVSKMDMRMTKSAAKGDQAAWTAIGSLFQAEMDSVMGVHIDDLNKRLWGTNTPTVTSPTAGAPSNEDADLWDNLHSIQDALRNDNTYAGLDRTTSGSAFWKGQYTTAATAPVFEDIINQINYDFGLADKGLAVDVIFVGGALFKIAKAEAKAKTGQVIFNGGIPEMGEFGFKKELVKIDNTWIIHDPGCPANHLAALNLSTWTLAIHPDANFTVSAPSDQQKIEGGDRAVIGTVETQIMVACEWPAGNAYYTNVA